MAPKITSRHKRVGLRLSVDVAGRDAQGARFTENTHTVNVSGGGLCFESAHPLHVGARVELTIALPTALRPRFGGRPLYRVSALVCRVERGRDGHRIGVRFLEELD
jgi:hypothetical protein